MEPFDFKASKDRKFLVVTNGFPNILIIETFDFTATKLLSVWTNTYKRYIYDIEISNSEEYIFASLYNKGLITIDIRDLQKPLLISELFK